MGLKDLREKFHGYDAKVSSKFHKDSDGLKKPSWGKIILTWLGLLIVLFVVSWASSVLLTVDVNQEITPTSSAYTLDYSSSKSSTYYIYSRLTGARQDAYHISHDGKLNIAINTSDIDHGDYFEEIMESYLNGENEYNASFDVNLTAYDSSGNKVDTFYFMGVTSSNSNIVLKSIDLLYNDNLKTKYKDGVLTLTAKGNDSRISDSSFNSSLKNIDNIECVIHVVNENAKEPSDSGFYSYTLNLTIPKNSINIKMS